MEIVLDKISIIYMKDTPFEKVALEDVKLQITRGSITGVIGHTGSGKSTLIQVIAGLLLPNSGFVKVGDIQWGNKKQNLSELRKRIGVVFQHPEHQLFAETVEKDIAFGLKNLDIDPELINIRVQEAMELVKLSYDRYKDTSPFKLSGGQMKRVALAGVLALKPQIIILDEPTSGLDPVGKQDILNLIVELNQKNRTTIIIVSHSMDEVARLSDNLVVLNNGKVALFGSPTDIFKQVDYLQKINLDLPEITKLINLLNKKIVPAIPLNCFTLDELEEHIINRLKGKIK